MKNEFLENEKLALERAIEETRKRGRENTYKNLIQAYERILLLIDKENKWESMYSHYGFKNDETGEFEDVVSTWEQKGEDIRNHNVYKIEKEISTPKVSVTVNEPIISNDKIKIPMIINGQEESIVGKKVNNQWVFPNGYTLNIQ